MDFLKLIKITEVKEYTLEEIEEFYKNCLTYKEYQNKKNLSKEEKIELYLDYYVKLKKILKFLKLKIESIEDTEEYYKNKKILSIHLKAIIDSKTNLNNKEEIEEYGFEYGWLDKDNYLEERFYECGLNLITKFKDFKVSSEYDEDDYSKYAQYYEWRKLIWMKTYLLIKDINKEYLEEYVKNKYKGK